MVMTLGAWTLRVIRGSLYGVLYGLITRGSGRVSIRGSIQGSRRVVVESVVFRVRALFGE